MDDATMEVRIAELEATAKQRYRRRLPLIAVVAVPVSVAAFLFTPSNRPHRSGHGSPWAFVFGIVFALVVVALLAWVIRRRRGLFREAFRPWLLLGLDKPERKRAIRGMRRGLPDDDPLVREVQLRSVRRYLRQNRHNKWIFLSLVVLEALVALLNVAAGRAWILYAISAAAFAAVWALSIVYAKRYRRFLARADAA